MQAPGYLLHGEQGTLSVSCHLLHAGVGQGRVASKLVAGQTDAGEQRHEVLLDAVVQVSFQAPPTRILRGDEAGPGRVELDDPGLDLLGQPAVVDRQGGLPSQDARSWRSLSR